MLKLKNNLFSIHFRSLWNLLSPILILVVLSNLYGQSNIHMIGSVRDDESGEPIVGAEIVIAGTQYQTFSDLEGYFKFENLPPGSYQLLVSSLGYRTKKIDHINVYADQTFRLGINLTHMPIPGDSITVIARDEENDYLDSADKLIIDASDLEYYKNLGMSQLLQQLPGIQIESIRANAGGAIIRIHGGNANQVLVLLDGQRLNNPQTGEVDLNVIPLESVDKIEISRAGNSAQFGANAFDGVISFQTKRAHPGTSAQISSRFGSFSTVEGAAHVSIGYASIGAMLDYQRQSSEQDFWFSHNNTPMQRQNAWYKYHQFFNKLEAKSDRHQLSLLYSYRRGDQGLPSAFYEEMEHFDAFSEEKFQTVQLNHRSFIHRSFYIQALLGYHSIENYFNNEKDFSPYTRYKGSQFNSISEGKIESVLQPFSPLLFRIGTQFLYEYLNGKNLLYPNQSIGIKYRQSSALYGSMEWSLAQFRSIVSGSQLRLALRYENALDLIGGIYPHLGISLVPRYLPFLGLSAGWGKSVRYPDFNSLFWKGDVLARGNPDLSPERKTQWNLAANFSFPGTVLPTLNLYYYDEKITDLIFWHRTVQGAWEPRNEENVDKKGWDIQLIQQIYKEFGVVNIAYSHIDAINKNEEPNRYNNRIVFIPEHSLNVSLLLNFSSVKLISVYRLVSERQVTAANTGVPLNSYQIVDLSAEYQISLDVLLFDFSFSVRNLFSENYELIRGYPMPGKEFLFSLKLRYKTL